MFESLYTVVVGILDKIIWYTDVQSRVHKIFLAPQLGDFRVFLGRVRAVVVYRFALARVPAYRDFMSKKQYKGPRVTFRGAELADIPEIDKASYVKQYSLQEKLVDGKIPTTGVMFDESSGSSGKPTSWVRGAKERRMSQRIMQVGYRHFIGRKNPIILNTFSMGAWATGLRRSASAENHSSTCASALSVSHSSENRRENLATGRSKP